MSGPTHRDLFRVFGKIGILSFGGPAAQISLMHQCLVDDEKWLDEDTFLRALSLCMLLPGPEAMQLATYAGWRLRGTSGGLIAGLLFVLPGAAVIAALAVIYVAIGDVPLVQAAFTGIKAAVIIIVLQALLKLSQKALGTPVSWTLAAAAFLALFALDAPYPLVIAGAALVGAILTTPSNTAPPPQSPIATKPISVIVTWGALWAAPIILIALTDQAFLLNIALFFSKLAVVTFGGAYAVLAYMTQTVVADYEWITTAQMIDALGLAETTPGPLILVTQFVAILAGATQEGLLLGIVAGLVALWVTFVPCFMWIFLTGPYLERIATRPRLSGALNAITSAVVGVILNLAIWFAIHVLFTRTVQLSGLAVPVPDLASLDVSALALTCVAAVLLIALKRGMAETLAILAICGLFAAVL
ncbi:MAG: chromate efflux transporter [Roseobacter sp.]